MVLVSFFLKGAKSVAGARLRLPGEPRVFPRRQAAGVPSSVTECPECVGVSLFAQRTRVPSSGCMSSFSLPSSQHRDRAPADLEEGPGRGALEHHASPGRGLRHGQRLRGKSRRRAADPGRCGQVPVPASGSASEQARARAPQTPPGSLLRLG